MTDLERAREFFGSLAVNITEHETNTGGGETGTAIEINDWYYDSDGVSVLMFFDENGRFEPGESGAQFNAGLMMGRH